MFGTSWPAIVRVVVGCVFAYTLLLALVRTTGKRTISKKNASDFIFTVAVGSAAATMVLNEDVSLIDGAVAIATFIGLQFALVSVSTRWEFGRNVLEGDPALLVYKGEILARQLVTEEVNPSEIFQAVRNQGITSLRDVHAVVLEIDGSFSVLRAGATDYSILDQVSGVPRQ